MNTLINTNSQDIIFLNSKYLFRISQLLNIEKKKKRPYVGDRKNGGERIELREREVFYL